MQYSYSPFLVKLRTLKSRIKRRRAEVDMAAGYIDEDRPR